MWCSVSWVMHWRLVALPMFSTWQLWMDNELCTMRRTNETIYKSVSTIICSQINAVVCK